MMACVADQIVAAPFAVVGSIGVIAQVPNVNRLLDKYNIDIELHTAGEYKRTLTMLGKNSEQGRAKFIEALEDVYSLFKDFLDVSKVATGESWYGVRAVDLHLVDKLLTSDEYLLAAAATANLYEVRWVRRHGLAERLTGPLTSVVSRIMTDVMQMGLRQAAAVMS
eukprot:jgi/Chlat1/1299/Chrsp118S08656